MVRRVSAAAPVFVWALVLTAFALGPFGGPAFARDSADLKPLEPAASIKPQGGEGYFDEVFGIDDAGKTLAVIRTDGATFAKVESYDLGAKPPKLTGSFE